MTDVGCQITDVEIGDQMLEIRCQTSEARPDI
jgi:hypothetical protein